jgi:tRNA A-37 threonylcarbamoyl transferase component Bud32
MSQPPETIAYCHSCGAPMDVSAVAPFSNVECPQCGKHTRVKREFGPYTLVRRHAVGGMSMVFAAHDNTLDREVALKILSEDYSADEKRIAAFEQEARLTASFSHPHVVRVLTTGRAFDRFYIAMELVPGGHFEHQIRERGKIPEIEMLPLAIEVAQGLKAAHAAGLIHRDVKPGNILLDAEGHAKLVDFGLALVTQGGKAQAEELWATPYYVPPETVEGHAEDFRSDIYAFGATLYHALAGKPPCGEESMATDVLREAKKRIIPLATAEPTISAETCRIVDKAMAYHPNQRFSSYDEMIACLNSALAHVKSGRAETPLSAAKRRAAKKRRERNILLASTAGLLAVTGLSIWWLTREKPAKPAPVTTTETPGEVPPPMVKDTSVEIATRYREARAAIEAKDYQKAAGAFAELLRDPAVQEPTRTWAGVEAVLAQFLDGKPGEARKQARETSEHTKSLSKESNLIGAELTAVLDKLGGLTPLPAPPSDASGAAHAISAMLAGLKNWEQGLLEPAAACFSAVTSIRLPANDQWAAVYQKLAGDYLSDHEILTGPLFATLPKDKTASDEAIDKLNTALVSLKTRGRARFNVRAWQLDITRAAALAKNNTATSPSPERTPGSAGGADELTGIASRFSGDCRFTEMADSLKKLPRDASTEKLASSLVSLAESSIVFLEDLENDLAKEPVSAELPLRSGETVTKVSIGADRKLSATTSAGSTKTCTWADFSPDALITLHRIFVRNPASDLERLRRHECAIAYDWLAGNRERALSAAAKLSLDSPSFRQRWSAITEGLPK